MRIRDMSMLALENRTKREFKKFGLDEATAIPTLAMLLGQDETFKYQDWYISTTNKTLNREFEDEQGAAEWIAKTANSEKVHNFVSKTYEQYGYVENK